jgi:hypothetical protein
MRGGRQCVRFRTNGCPRERRVPQLRPWRTICGRRRRRRLDVHGARQTDAHGSSDDAALKTVGEPCESRGTAGSLGCCAQCGEAAVAGRRRIDWTGEVRKDRLSETNFIRKPISTVRGTTEPSSAADPRNRARRNFGKCLPPRTKIRPWVPRRTISSYTLARVPTTIASPGAHESM